MKNFSKSQIRKMIKIALKEVDKNISGFASRSGIYAGGLASEGYDGGYRDALYDVETLLNNMIPNRRTYWYRVNLCERCSKYNVSCPLELNNEIVLKCIEFREKV